MVQVMVGILGTETAGEATMAQVGEMATTITGITTMATMADITEETQFVTPEQEVEMVITTLIPAEIQGLIALEAEPIVIFQEHQEQAPQEVQILHQELLRQEKILMQRQELTLLQEILQQHQEVAPHHRELKRQEIIL